MTSPSCGPYSSLLRLRSLNNSILAQQPEDDDDLLPQRDVCQSRHHLVDVHVHVPCSHDRPTIHHNTHTFRNFYAYLQTLFEKKNFWTFYVFGDLK